jgi:hypothetical protein
MDVCVLWVLCLGSGICFGLITRPEKSYLVQCVWVWSWSLENEEALAHYGLSRHRTKEIKSMTNTNEIKEYWEFVGDTDRGEPNTRTAGKCNYWQLISVMLICLKDILISYMFLWTVLPLWFHMLVKNSLFYSGHKLRGSLPNIHHRIIQVIKSNPLVWWKLPPIKYIQGCTNFPKIWKPPLNSRRHMGDTWSKFHVETPRI